MHEQLSRCRSVFMLWWICVRSRRSSRSSLCSFRIRPRWCSMWPCDVPPIFIRATFSRDDAGVSRERGVNAGFRPRHDSRAGVTASIATRRTADRSTSLPRHSGVSQSHGLGYRRHTPTATGNTPALTRMERQAGRRPHRLACVRTPRAHRTERHGRDDRVGM